MESINIKDLLYISSPLEREKKKMDSINITDIKKLPRLYEEKAELEKMSEELQ